eukprot:scaffold46500_cov19-Tisochrysis_lutea.AAC.1
MLRTQRCECVRGSVGADTILVGAGGQETNKCAWVVEANPPVLGINLITASDPLSSSENLAGTMLLHLRPCILLLLTFTRLLTNTLCWQGRQGDLQGLLVGLHRQLPRHPAHQHALLQVEERAVGQVDRAIYKTYLSAWSPAFMVLPIFVVVLALSERGMQ